MKKTGFIIGLGAISIIVFICLIFFFMGIGYKNDESRLRNDYEAQKNKIELVHDNMWKQIKQIAQISDKYQESFDSIYTHIMSARYSKTDGVVMNWVKEHNPQFSPELYVKLSDVIEVERQRFLDSQTKILDIVREQNNMLDMFPSSWFLSGRKRLEWNPISSTYSKKVMSTGKDDDIDVFN